MAIRPRRLSLFSSASGGGPRFTEALGAIERRAAEGPVTIGELFTICGQQGQAFVAIFLVLPFLQPVPLPGISSVIGFVLVIIGAFVALRRPPWLPERLKHAAVEAHIVLRICHSLERLFGRLERVVRPTAAWLFDQKWFRMLNGAIWIVHALVFSLPLPIPLTNFFPAVVILLLAIGTLEEDFRVVAVAYVAAVVNVAFFAGLVALPTLGIQAVVP